MQLFKCLNCSQLLHFEDRECVSCHSRLGYAAADCALYPVTDIGNGNWQPIQSTVTYQFCANADFEACNWLVGADEGFRYCAACRYNRNIPDLSVGNNLMHWRKVERAKHHLFYSLLRMNLPLANRLDDPRMGLAFDFLAVPLLTARAGDKVMTGHDDGIITLNLVEADDAIRERRRVAMGEPYRTLLGHFRHETGHYFWDRLVAPTEQLLPFRARFGDETVDYDEALRLYYAKGPTQGWDETFVSAYATAHPWEDFAETWAHYLHIVDTIEMASAYGLCIRPPVVDIETSHSTDRIDPYREGTIGDIMTIWLPITLAVNSLSRCIGQPDFYPLVLSPAIVEKLGFIHELIRYHRVPAVELTGMVTA